MDIVRKGDFMMKETVSRDCDLFRWEIKKLWSQPMILTFLLLCVAFQIVLAARDRYLEPGGDYAVYVAWIAREGGQRMGKEFTETVLGSGNRQEEMSEQRQGQTAECRPAEDEDLYRERLLGEMAGTEDIYEDYCCGRLADGLLRQFRITGWPARMMERKYQRQQAAVDLLAKRKDSLDVSSAGMTQPVMDALFGTQCRAFITEAMVLAVLMALSVSGSERTARTQLTVYATRTGRKIQYAKAAAGLVSALAAYDILAVSSLGFFALVWYPAPAWNASISSQFHYMSLAGAKLPFITWKPFTTGEYLLAVVTLGAVVVTLFYVLAFCVGLWVKSAWTGFVFLFLLVVVNFQVIMMAGDSFRWTLYLCAQWTPAGLWWLENQWFTDMLINGAVPWQECAVAALWTVLCGLMLAVSFYHMKKEDVC